MALKKLITAEEFAALTEDMKKEYVLFNDGKYHLDLEDDDAAELKRAKDHEKERRKNAEEALRIKNEEEAAAQRQAAEAAAEAAKAKGDVEALDLSWQEKYNRDVEEARQSGTAANAALKGVFVNKVAQDMADAISTVPDLLVDRIKARLDVEIHDGNAITRVLSPDGKPSAMSLDELKKEFVDNKNFASIIKASDAQGGGAGPGDNGGGAPAKKLSEMTATEEAAYANEFPEQYKRMLEGKA